MSEINPAFQFMKSRYEHLRDKHSFMPTSILDVGACKGQWATIVKEVWPEAHMCLVDGDPRVKDELLTNFPDNELYFNVLDSNEGMKTFYIRDSEDPYTWGSSSLRMENTQYFKENYKEVQVSTETLHSLFGLRLFDLIKIDAQGSELDILAGGPWITTGAKYIQLECSLIYYNEKNPLLHTIIAEMFKYGFIVQDILQLHYWESNDCIQLDFLFKNVRT